jgi:hypothetical protein
MSNINFYSKFFARESFLSPSESNLYSDAAYLDSLGFSPRLDFTDKVVLELGAGAGRLTLALQRMGLVQSARKYIVVEPSSAIERIRERLKLDNVVFVNSGLRDLATHVPYGSIDYFIASGVIPHLNHGSLPDSIGAIVPFLSTAGRLHAHASFYGYDKRGHILFKAACQRMPLVTSTVAGLAAALQFGLCGIGLSAVRSIYVRNFLYSFQRGFLQVHRFMFEVFTVEPYSIFWSYRDYAAALALNGLAIEELFPHSIALVAGRRKRVDDEPILRLPRGSVAILGNDWSGRWFARRYGRPADVVDTVEQATEYHTIVLAYDYSRGPPYHTFVRALRDRGYELGRNLYLFQMLLD